MLPAPDDHFAAGPDGREQSFPIRRVRSARSSPAVGVGIVSPTGVQRTHPAPDDHFAVTPYDHVLGSSDGHVDGARGCPTIAAGIISAAGVETRATVRSAPDNHFTACPDRPVRFTINVRPWNGRVKGGGCRPTVCHGVCTCRRCLGTSCHPIHPRRSFVGWCWPIPLCASIGQRARS